jgi:hypothetical protein
VRAGEGVSSEVAADNRPCLGDGFQEEMMMDMAEGEAEELLGDSMDELELTYQEGDPLGFGGDLPFDEVESITIDAGSVAEVADGFAAAAEAAGLPDDLPAGPGVGSSSSSSGPMQHEEVPPPPLAPWQCLSAPSGAGYVYDGMRSVLRIQRGKPKNSVTVTCYRHSGCHLLLSQARCPSDETLCKWLFEVGVAPVGAPKEVGKQLAQDHMRLGKSRWSAKGQAGLS